jgi:hypothetical protein
MDYKTKYKEYLKSNHWREFRQRVLDFWSNQCALCPCLAKEVHHRHYRSLGKEVLTDCIALCRVCHERHHQSLLELRLSTLPEYKALTSERHHFYWNRYEPFRIEHEKAIDDYRFYRKPFIHAQELLWYYKKINQFDIKIEQLRKDFFNCTTTVLELDL